MRAAGPILGLMVLAAARVACAQPAETDYDARLRSAFAAAESFQGPLDGGWTLSIPGEGPFYALRFVDHDDTLEAVWRDLRRPGALDASGFVDKIRRQDGRLTLSFTAASGQLVAATLRSDAGGGWTGELSENGRTRPARLARTPP